MKYMELVLCLHILCVILTEGKGKGKGKAKHEDVNHDADVNDDETLKPKKRFRIYFAHLTDADSYNENEPPPYVHHHADSKMEDIINENATDELAPWVKLILQPVGVDDLSMKKMEFKCDFNLFLTWEDGRFRKPAATLDHVVPDSFDVQQRLKNYQNNPFLLSIWLPTITFINAKGKNSVLISPTMDISLMKITLHPRIQRVAVNYKLAMDFFCVFIFTRYPFDEQRCVIQISYAHSETPVNWIHDMLLEDKEQIHVPPEYRLISLTHSACPNSYSADKELIECAEYVFIFQRVYDQHIMLLFIPSMLIVSLSWISFWLDEAVAPPRVALGLTSILTLATQFNNAQKDLPAVSDIKAIDIWMFACMIMVFSSLLEFCVANYCHRIHVKPAPPVKSEPEPKEPTQPKLPIPRYVYRVPVKPKVTIDGYFKDSSLLKISRKSNGNKTKCCFAAKGNKIDICSRILFPLVFLVFNIVYWTYYTA